MPNLQFAIEQAWSGIRPALDDHALAARLQRRRTPTLMRPPRAWCLALRASDRRLQSSFTPDAPSSPSRQSTINKQQSLLISPELLRHLCSPIRIHGDFLDEAAAKLGTTPTGLRNARIKNTLSARHFPGLAGRRGKPIPLLYADAPLDPNARLFARADPVWSWTASWLLDRLPRTFEQTLTRIPHYRPHVPRGLYDEHRHPELDAASKRIPKRLPPPEPDYVWYKWSRSGYFLGDDPTNWRKGPQDLGERPPRYLRKRKQKRKPKPSTSAGSLHFNGYLWLCPICKKTCRTLYLPLPPINLLKDVPKLAKCVDIPPLLPLPAGGERDGERGKRRLDATDVISPKTHSLPTFACRRCHRVQFLSPISKNYWNDLIAYLTAGLLYGREVPRPAWFTPQRKRPFKPLINRRAVKREQVFDRLLKGWPRARIAADLGMTAGALSLQMWKIFKQHGVRSQRALLKKHNQPLPPHLLLSPDKVLHHIRAGLSQSEIAAAMGITKQAVQSYTYHLRKSGRLPKRPLKRDSVARLLTAGLSTRAIAARLGLSIQNVYDHAHALRRSGHPLPPKPETKQQQVHRRLLAGQSYKQIAREMGITLRAAWMNAHYARKSAAAC